MWSSTVLVMAENIPITEKFSPEQLDLEEDIEGGLEKITLDLNELSDEEKYSQTMPEKHKCDGCMAIAYTLHTALQIKHLKNQHIKQYRIPESQLLELFGNFFSIIILSQFYSSNNYCDMHLSIYKFDLHFFPFMTTIFCPIDGPLQVSWKSLVITILLLDLEHKSSSHFAQKDLVKWRRTFF